MFELEEVGGLMFDNGVYRGSYLSYLGGEVETTEPIGLSTLLANFWEKKWSSPKNFLDILNPCSKTVLA